VTIKKVDTSYQTFSFCIKELRDKLHSLHGFVEKVEDDVMAHNMFISRSLFHIVDHISCLMRDLHSGHINYTNKPSKMFKVKDKSVFLLSFRKAYVNTVNALDDFYLEKLHTPFWVCRHASEDGKEFWSLSNISNEISTLLNTVDHTLSMLTESRTVIAE